MTPGRLLFASAGRHANAPVAEQGARLTRTPLDRVADGDYAFLSGFTGGGYLDLGGFARQRGGRDAATLLIMDRIAIDPQCPFTGGPGHQSVKGQGIALHHGFLKAAGGSF